MAAVIHLDEWREWHVAARAQRGDPMPADWGALAMLNSGPDKRDAVSMYARLGLHPILLHGVNADGSCTCGDAHENTKNSIGKHPVHRGWQTAPLDVAAVDRGLRENWRRNVGLRMGRQPGGFSLVAIDVDGPRALLAPLEAELGALPPTLCQTSGKGTHYIYIFPSDRRMPKNRVRLADGVDVRSEGGQIVAAPSLHRSGRRYRWLDAREPEVLP